MERVAAFLLAGYFSRHFVYNQLDLPLGMLIAAALLLLVSRVPYAWSYAVLALAVSFKVVPLMLAPIWVIATIPAALLTGRWSLSQWLQFGTACLGRLALLAGMILLVCLPFYILAGPRCLAFFEFHRERGIELESTYGAVLGILHLFGYPLQVQATYGCYEFASSFSPSFRALSPMVVSALLLIAFGLVGVNLIRKSRSSELPCPSASLGQLYPQDFAGTTILFLLVFLLGNKVFSPQYVLWLLPLAPLTPMTSWVRRVFLIGFVGLCAVTWLIFPRYSVFVWIPTPFGTGLLILRTLLLVGLILGLTVPLLRRVRTARPRAVPEEYYSAAAS
jgi:hypothetical protein